MATASTTPNPDDPGSTGDPKHPDTGTRDKVAAGNPDADANTAGSTKSKSSRSKEAKEAEQAQHDKEIRRAQRLGIAGADKMKRADLQAELNRPENFSSLLDRDTTHFENLHYGAITSVDLIDGSSDLNRQMAAQSVLAAVGLNVNPGSDWTDTEEAVRTWQENHDLEPTGRIDRETWDALGDELFPS